MLEIVEAKHHVPGRIRLSLTFARGNREVLDRIRAAIESLAGVERIQSNSTIGAIIIYYDPSMFAEFPRQLSEFAARQNLFQLDTALLVDNGVDEQSLTDQALELVAGRINRSVQAGTANGISLKELLPFGIAAWAFMFVNRAAAAAQWLSWIQFAWSSYFELHQEDPVHDIQREVGALRADITTIRSLLENAQMKPHD